MRVEKFGRRARIKLSQAESKVSSLESSVRSSESKVTADGYSIVTAQNGQAAAVVKVSSRSTAPATRSRTGS